MRKDHLIYLYEIREEGRPLRFAPNRYSHRLYRCLTPSKSGRTNGRYLRHFEKLGQFGHPVEEGLVELQSFFALVLLHVEVFLCVPEDEKQLKKQNLL